MKIRSIAGLGTASLQSILQKVCRQRSCTFFPAADADELSKSLAAGTPHDLLIADSSVPKLHAVLDAFRRDNPETIAVLVHDRDTPCPVQRQDVFAILDRTVSEETLSALLDAAETHRDAINETAYYRAQIANTDDELVGHSEPIRAIYQKIYELARGAGHVLLSGSPGVGKSLLVRTLHRSSSRVCRALISVNCSMSPGKLLERKLFSFKETSGGGLREPFGRLWDLTANGTLYLERVECLTPEVQDRFYNAVADPASERANDSVAGPRRLIFSSRLSVDELKAQGFKRELLDRMTVMSVPELKERREDIPLLSDYFLKQFNQRYRLNVALSTEAREALFAYDWPGNIRELRVCIERALFLAQSGTITEEHLGFRSGGPTAPPAQSARISERPTPPVAPKPIAAAVPSALTPERLAAVVLGAPATAQPAAATDSSQVVFRVGQSLEEIESEMIQKTMAQSGNNRTHAAKMLNISVRTLYTKLLDIEQRGKLVTKSDKKDADPPGKNPAN